MRLTYRHFFSCIIIVLLVCMIVVQQDPTELISSEISLFFPTDAPKPTPEWMNPELPMPKGREDDGTTSISNRSLVRHALVVGRLAKGDSARYFTVIDVSGHKEFGRQGELWVFARSGDWPNAFPNSNVQLWTGGTPADMLPKKPTKVIKDQNIAHNFGAMFVASGVLFGAGGESKKRKYFGEYEGISLFTAASRQVALQGMPSWGSTLGVIRGEHRGCVENRRTFHHRCEFDGRVSLAAVGKLLFMYVRSNIHRVQGGRYVQVTQAKSPTGPWSEFTLVSFEGYSWEEALQGSIYFGAVNSNPVNDATLLGLFPVLSGDPQLKESQKAFIAMAISCDGIHFSRLLRILDSVPAHGGRTFDHPVDGWVRRADEVYFFMQRDVPGISRNVSGSRLIRYTIRASDLQDYTQREVQVLRQRGFCA